MTEANAVDWFEEGRKQFVASKVRPDQPPQNYPTQDAHTPKDEAEYISGFNYQEAAWNRGERFAGMEAYMRELEEERAERGEKQ